MPVVGESVSAVVMRRMEFEDGRVGWYIDHPDFYCDLEPGVDGLWSVYFRGKDGGEVYGERIVPGVVGP